MACNISSSPVRSQTHKVVLHIGLVEAEDLGQSSPRFCFILFPCSICSHKFTRSLGLMCKGGIYNMLGVAKLPKLPSSSLISEYLRLFDVYDFDDPLRNNPALVNGQAVSSKQVSLRVSNFTLHLRIASQTSWNIHAIAKHIPVSHRPCTRTRSQLISRSK